MEYEQAKTQGVVLGKDINRGSMDFFSHFLGARFAAALALRAQKQMGVLAKHEGDGNGSVAKQKV